MKFTKPFKLWKTKDKSLGNSFAVKVRHSNLLGKIAFFVVRGPPFNLLSHGFRDFLSFSVWDKNIDTNNQNHTKECTFNHIKASVKWLLELQNNNCDGGIPATIHYEMGKPVVAGSYPEVNGYLIPTLFDYAKAFNDKIVFECAIKLSEFELTQQDVKTGSFPGGSVGSLTSPSVFNSAQIIHGLVRSYKETKSEKYLEAVSRACNWIVSVQEDDGAWGVNNYRGLKRTYDSKVSQSLLEAYRIVEDPMYLKSAIRNLDFVVDNQLRNGWFYNCDNTNYRNHEPLTHLIGYTIQGLLVSSDITGNNKYYFSAKKALLKLLHMFEVSKHFLYGRYNYKWSPTVHSCCVTGLAQISICWLEIFLKTKDFRFLNAGFKANDIIKDLQISSSDKYVNGALPASSPAWGDYGTYAINTWGVKYFIDALLLEYKIKKELDLNGKNWFNSRQ